MSSDVTSPLARPGAVAAGPAPFQSAPQARLHYPPPKLDTWSLVWRYGLCAISLLQVAVLNFVIATASKTQSSTADATPLHFPLWQAIVDLVVSVAMFWPIRYRRRHPLAVLGLLTAMATIGTAGSMIQIWAYVSVCTRRRRREVLVAVAMQVVGISIVFATNPFYGPAFAPPKTGSRLPWLITLGGTILLQVAGLVIMTVVGFYTGARREIISTLRDRAETAEREQELRVLQGQAAERNRIAREMHDVLAHRMSLVSMHAGALAYRKDLEPDEMREVATIIQTNAHSALQELRTVLGTLRTEDGANLPPEKPQPTMEQIEALIDEVRAGGDRIDFDQSVERPDLLPTQTGRHAYRVLQEGLTNARKHAPGAKITVRLSGSPGEGLSLRVSNPTNSRGGVVPGAMLGLVGLGERAAITGGRIRHEVDDAGDFVLEVWLPW